MNTGCGLFVPPALLPTTWHTCTAPRACPQHRCNILLSYQPTTSYCRAYTLPSQYLLALHSQLLGGSVQPFRAWHGRPLVCCHRLTVQQRLQRRALTTRARSSARAAFSRNIANVACLPPCRWDPTRCRTQPWRNAVFFANTYLFVAFVRNSASYHPRSYNGAASFIAFISNLLDVTARGKRH